VNVTAPRGLVPPRPNLGPEPWSETPSMQSAYVALALLAILAGAALYGVWRHRRIARVKTQKLPLLDRPDATPRERLIGLAGSLREALTDRFGASYRARTIEELAADRELTELLGGELFEQLNHFLDQIDRLKFAPVRTPHHQHVLEQELVDWEPRVKNLMTRIRAKPSGKSDPGRSHRHRVRARRRRLESERL
jgi:hypothetical protein